MKFVCWKLMDTGIPSKFVALFVFDLKLQIVCFQLLCSSNNHFNPTLEIAIFSDAIDINVVIPGIKL